MIQEETSFRSPFKRHRANVTRTRLGSRKKGGGRRLGEVGRGVPWVSRSLARRRVQEAPGGLTGAASAGGSFCLRGSETGPGERPRRSPACGLGWGRTVGRDADLEGARAREGRLGVRTGKGWRGAAREGRRRERRSGRGADAGRGRGGESR